MTVPLRQGVQWMAAIGAIAGMVGPVASLAAPAASDAASPAVAASAAPQASPGAQSQAARIVSGLRIIGRVRARTSFCSALVQGGAPATAGALGYEAALAQTIADLRHVSLSNPLTKAQSMRPLEDDLRALADLAQAGRTELHDLGSVAERSEPNLRRAVLGYRDALDGAKARQYFLAKQIASTVGKLEEIPADSFISGADDPNILLNAVLPTVPGTNVNRLYDDLSDPDVTPATDPAFNEALTVDDRTRSDLQTAADHAAPSGLARKLLTLSKSRLERMHDVLSGTSNVRNVERREMPGLAALAFGDPAPMKHDTIFRIASITKLVTAVAAMLVEECWLGGLRLPPPAGIQGDLHRAAGESAAMLRITTFNANGIRAAARKGFFTWLRRTSPDVLCMQETKAQEHQLPPEALDLDMYRRYAFVDAQKKGYSGVALYAKVEPDAIVRGLGMPDIDAEGRYVRFDWGDLSISSLYVPSGTSGEARQAIKDGFLERFLGTLVEMRHDGRRHIVCGDYNVAHKEIDTFDPVRNAHVTGHLPHERLWMDSLIDEVGWVDAFREVDREPRRYTWWSNWPGAFERNLGWRIDLQLITPNLSSFVRGASIERNERFSDHAPLTMTYDLALR